MLVYQAIHRLAGSAQIRAVLDGSEYEQERLERDEATSDEDSSQNGDELDLGCDSYLTEFLIAPPLLEQQGDDLLDPATITHHAFQHDGRHVPVQTIPKRKVTWLNGSPQLFEELAVAFIAVSQ
jgi:hypothetical protein